MTENLGSQHILTIYPLLAIMPKMTFMKDKKLYYLLSSIFLSQICFATPAEDINSINNQARIAFSLLTLDYAEKINHIVLDKENGNIPGVSIAMSKTLNRFLINPSIRFYRGEETYRGSFIEQEPGVFTLKADGDTLLLKATINVGYLFALTEKSVLTPFLSYGYRYWYRGSVAFPIDVNSSENGQMTDKETIGVNGYSEIYENQCLSAGLLWQYNIRPNVVIGTYASAGSTFSSQLSGDFPGPIEINDEIFGTVTLDQNLGSKPIYQAGINVDYRISGQFHCFAGIEYEYFHFGKSKPNIFAIYEPPSKTTEWIATIGLAVDFA